ncbi:hypothetical protein [Streptomyces sp. NPDC006510]|uniref:hypothetical protein n=1 Tax=Streptomyces sp. NPDC006510 TaxID=3155600 RepID=UPI0033BE5380
MVGVRPAAGELFTQEEGPLVAGFNFLLERPAPQRTAGRRQQSPGLLAAAADLLGAGTAAAVETEGHAMLCLSHTVPVPAPMVEWPLDRLHRQPASARALFEALALAAPRGQHSARFLIGLWTAEYGYLHTGHLTLHLWSYAYDCSGAVVVELTGVHQELRGETRSGPWAHSAYFEFTPAVTPAQASAGTRRPAHRCWSAPSSQSHSVPASKWPGGQAILRSSSPRRRRSRRRSRRTADPSSAPVAPARTPTRSAGRRAGVRPTASPRSPVLPPRVSFLAGVLCVEG